ncbi:hypothetical protein FQZ97_1167100 [compost metagenome]
MRVVRETAFIDDIGDRHRGDQQAFGLFDFHHHQPALRRVAGNLFERPGKMATGQVAVFGNRADANAAAHVTQHQFLGPALLPAGQGGHRPYTRAWMVCIHRLRVHGGSPDRSGKSVRRRHLKSLSKP